MPLDVSLVDLFRPYILRGENTPWHAALEVLYVESLETAVAAEGVTIRGVAKFSGDVRIVFDPLNGVLRVQATNAPGHPANQPDRRDPWLDITNPIVEFALTAPRAASGTVMGGIAGVPAGNTALPPLNTVLNALDPAPVANAISDYPATAFTLDLVFSGIELRPPFLKPAKMLSDGLLVPDPTKPDVTFLLPKIKIRLSQDVLPAAGLDVTLASLGVSGLDDPGDLAAAELITMDPPYAFIGTGRTVGFGFRSAFLDLSAGYTPPAVLDQFGFDESWTGLYLPEVRIFVAPNGMEDFAVNAGVRNLLIGLGATPGITGDFELMVINQGDGDLLVGARFVKPDGTTVGIVDRGDGTADAAIGDQARLVIDVSGGRAPYTRTATFDGNAHGGAVHDITLGATQEKTVIVLVEDSGEDLNKKSKTLAITVRRKIDRIELLPAGTGPAKPASVRTDSITLDGVAQLAPALQIVSQTATSVVVGLTEPHPATTWTVDGGAPEVGLTVTIPLAGGETRAIRAEVDGEQVTKITGYFRFDQPPVGFDAGFATNPDNIGSTQAVDPSATAIWTPPAKPFLDKHRETIKRIASPFISVEGTASYEGDNNKAKYNYLLSRRRAQAIEQLLKAQTSKQGDEKLPSFQFLLEPPDIGTAPPSPTWVQGWKQHGAQRSQWWKAVLGNFGSVALPGPVTEGQATRPLPDATPPMVIEFPDTPPAEPATPDWFRSAALKVRIIQNQFVAVELTGEVDFQTATEERLKSGGVPGSDMPTFKGLGSQNPADGIVRFQILYQTDPASRTEELKLYLGADPADRDGLVMTGTLPGQPLEAPSTGRNALGMITVFTPLLAKTAPADPANGSVGEILLSAAVVGLPIALAEAGLFTVERVVLYGGELSVLQKGDLWQSTLLFDVETAISANVSFGGFSLLTVPRDKPIAVRYKAIGLKTGFPPGGGGRFELRPMFDQSKGYTIDVSSPGAITVPDPLGKILQVAGARIARTNPLSFEIDLAFAFDLGVVTIERAGVRLTIDDGQQPPAIGVELTAFGASINVPGTIEGRGYMEMKQNPFEMKGMIDISLVPVKMRIAAGLAVAHIDAAHGGPQTGVAIMIDVQLPVAIPLANSGFGIYGFLGLFAMHYARNEDTINSLTPALDWLKGPAGGNPANLAAWKPAVDRWAFGVGALLGTMEGGIIFNMKGVVMLELPGPRLLLMMKANLLTIPPDLKEAAAEGTFLAVVDLDFGRGVLSIGLSIDFSIKPIVEIFIPIEAYFNLKKGSDWHLYLGTFKGNDTLGRPMPGPIHATILFVFDGSGYVMVSGHGIPAYKQLSAVSGVGLAVGLEVGVLWGEVSINLYLRANAGFNAVLGFDPFYVGGILYARGELHIFIISISASAEIIVQVGTRSDGTEVSRLDGEVCGEIDLFFFTIKGCVDFHLGEDGQIMPPAPELVRAVTLVSRSPALVVGTGVDRGIDSSLGDALNQSSQPAAGHVKVPVVPIDAIPVVLMSATPVAETLTILGVTPGGSTGAPSGGFIERGDIAYRYDLSAVELARADGGEVTLPGKRPSTWWTQNDPADANLVANLSLLNWTPNPTPKAVERSELLEELVKERWGTTCRPTAPASPVLWTLEREPLGPSETGWRLNGKAWPDPPKTKRSGPPDLDLDVTEHWRTGERDLDRARGIIPAIVEGRLVPCGDREDAPEVPRVTDAPRIFATAPAESLAFTARVAEEQRRIEEAVAASFGLRKAERFDPEPAALGTVDRRVASGLPVSRSSLAMATSTFGLAPVGLAVELAGRATATPTSTAVATTTTEPAGQCIGRMLAAPMFDYGAPIVFGDLTRSDEVAAELELIGWKHGPLDDVVVIHAGPIVAGSLLLYVRRQFLMQSKDGKDGAALIFLDAKGGEIARRGIAVTDQLPVVGVPPHWVDQQGPWAEEIAHVFGFGNLLQPHGYLPVVIRLDKMPDLDRIEIGLLHRDWPVARKQENGRPYYVGAVELTRRGEAERADWDESESKKNREVLEQFLGPASGDVALLHPNKLYKLTTTAKVTTRKPDGGAVDGGTQTEVFWFHTDAAAPARLDPWMLVTQPAEGESHVFGHEPLVFLFATNDIDRLYGAYGKELRVRIKAASFRQVDQLAFEHPVTIDKDSGLKEISPGILSPFEAVLTDPLLNIAPCVPVSVKRTRHSKIEIPIPLDPFTDYLIDIEAVDIGAAKSARGDRVFRRAFTTGAFLSLDEFVLGFQGAPTEHRFAPAGKLQGIGNIFATHAPEGAEFDEALIGEAGLEPMPVPRAPRTVVFWETGAGGVPAPAAVLIDAPEPMHRIRPFPTEVPDEAVPPATRWKLVETPWLTLAKSADSDDIVARIVFAPGRQRALVTLKPGSRGKLLKLGLVHTPLGGDGTDETFTVVEERLARAPWEEV